MGVRTALVWYSIFSTGTDFLGSLYIVIKFGSVLQLNLHECYFETFTSLCHSETSSDVRRDKKWTWLQTMSAEAPPTVDPNIVRVPLAEVKLWLLMEHKSYFRGSSQYLTQKKVPTDILSAGGRKKGKGVNTRSPRMLLFGGVLAQHPWSPGLYSQHGPHSVW